MAIAGPQDGPCAWPTNHESPGTILRPASNFVRVSRCPSRVVAGVFGGCRSHGRLQRILNYNSHGNRPESVKCQVSLTNPSVVDAVRWCSQALGWNTTGVRGTASRT